MKSIPKVLFCPSDRQGVGHWRSIWPAQNLKRHFSDQVEVHIDASPNVENINELAKYDIIHFNDFHNHEHAWGLVLSGS